MLRQSFFAAVLGVACVAGTANAGLLGHQFTCGSKAPAFECESTSLTVGAGIETYFRYIANGVQRVFSVDLDDTGLTLTYASGLASISFPGPPQGLTLRDETSPITGATLVNSSIPAFTDNQVSLVSGLLGLEFGTIRQMFPGDSIRIDITTRDARVPEPGVAWLVGAAIAAAVAFRRRPSA